MISTRWQKKFWASLGLFSALASVMLYSLFFTGRVHAAPNTGTYTRINNVSIEYKPTAGGANYYNYGGGPFFDSYPNTNNVDKSGQYASSEQDPTYQKDYLSPSWTRTWCEIDPASHACSANLTESAGVVEGNAGAYIVYQNKDGNLESVNTDNNGTSLTYPIVFIKSKRTVTTNPKGGPYPNTTYYIQDKTAGVTCPAFFLKEGNSVWYSQPIPNPALDIAGNPLNATAAADTAYHAAAMDPSIGYPGTIKTCSADYDAITNHGGSRAISSLSGAIGGTTDSLNHLNSDYANFADAYIDDTNGANGVGYLAATALGGTNGWGTVVGDINAGAARAFIINIMLHGTQAQKAALSAGGTSAASKPVAETCDIFGNSALRWLLCPLFSAAVSFTNLLQHIIGHLLELPTNLFSTSPVNSHASQGGGLYTAWQVFRGISLTILVIAAIIMVISQVLGFGFLDAYTIKKVLPRLLIAIIGISLSWAILEFVVTLFNDLGDAVGQIIQKAFGTSTPTGDSNQIWQAIVAVPADVVGLGGSFAGGIAAVSSITVWGPAALSLLFVIGIGLLIGVAILGLRIAVICACIIMAPLAIASYILPGTKKLWDFWKDTLFTSLLMYPIVIGFLSLGAGLAAVLANTGQSVLLSILVYFAPYFLLPFAFKLSGGLMKSVVSVAEGKSKGVFDKQRKFRSDRKAARTQMQIDGKRGGIGFGKFNTAEFRRRASIARHGEAAAGAGYTGAYQQHTEQVALKTLQEAGSIVKNDEVMKRVAAGDTEQQFLAARSSELTKDFVRIKKAAYERENVDAYGKGIVATGAALTQIEESASKDAHSQAHSEAGRIHAALGGFGTKNAINVATRARIASPSAYNADLGAEQNLKEVYADVARLIKSGDISSGDGIGMIKQFAASRPDLKNASAGKMLDGLNEATYSSSGTISSSTAKIVQRSGIRNMKTQDYLHADARTSKISAAGLFDLIKDNRIALDKAQMTHGEDSNEYALANREYKASLATAANIQEGLSSTSAEHREHFSNMLGSSITTADSGGEPINILQEVERLRPDQEFQQFRREYGNAADASRAGEGGKAPDQPAPTPGKPA